MKIYVAGSWEHREWIRLNLIVPLSADFKITFNWTSEEKKLSPLNKAMYDSVGVRLADAVIVCPGESGTGFEWGLAYGLGKKIVLYDSPETKSWKIRQNVFEGLPWDRVESYGELISWLYVVESLLKST